MTKTKRGLFLIIPLVIVLAVSLYFVFRTTNDVVADYVYTESNGGVSIIEAPIVSDKVISVPEEIDGKAVVGISSGAFEKNKDLKTLTIPDTVTEIEAGALSGMEKLEELNIPFVGRSKDAVGEEKLFGYIFGTVSGTGSYTLQNYSATESKGFYIPHSLKTVTVSGGNLGYGSFFGCKNLENVTLGEEIVNIPDYSFRGTINLKNITLNGQIAQVGDCAFYNSAITEIDLSKVTAIGKNAFTNTALNSANLSSAISIGEKGFSGTQLKELTFGENLSSIGDYAFAYNYFLTEVNLPSSLTEIGVGVFYQNKRLTAVNCSGDNFTSDAGVLYTSDKTKLIVYPTAKRSTEFTVPNSVNIIYENAFNGNVFLKTVTVGDSVSEIGYSAFSGCAVLRTLNLKFKGASASATGVKASLGYIFGENYFEGCKITTETIDGVVYNFCLPKNLSVVYS